MSPSAASSARTRAEAARRSRCSRCTWVRAIARTPGTLRVRSASPKPPKAPSESAICGRDDCIRAGCNHARPWIRLSLDARIPPEWPPKRKTSKAVRRKRPAATRVRKPARRRTAKRPAPRPGRARRRYSRRHRAASRRACRPSTRILAVANVRASMPFLEQHARLHARRRAAGRRRAAALRGDARRASTVVMLVAQGRRDRARRRRGGALHLRRRRRLGAQRARATPAPAAATRRHARGATAPRSVTDPDGYRWVLATFKKLVPFAHRWPGSTNGRRA